MILTASGESLKSVENYIDNNVIALYAIHIHKQTTLYEARGNILKSASIKGDKNDDVIIFGGNGVRSDI